MAKATFAAGCFWGVEETFTHLPGVLATRVGYTGGQVKNPTYEMVCRHDTGHAEAIEIEYDPSKISYETLLEVFFNNHNPTTLNRQGPDVGSQYRSAIFYHTPEQQVAAQKATEDLQRSNKFGRPIVTAIVAANVFYPAEEYHQKYLQKQGKTHC